MTKGKALIVDDEKNLGLVLQAMLEKGGFDSRFFSDSALVFEALDSEDWDVVLTDLYMPGPGGLEILDYCQANRPELPVVILTAFGTVDSAVQALKRGAFDFITKPFDQKDLLLIVQKAMSERRAREKEPVPVYSSKTEQPIAFAGNWSGLLSGQSTAIQTVQKFIEKNSQNKSTVTIMGEEGAGREIVARELHQRSSRGQQPFVRLHCGAIPQELLQGEFLGVEKKCGRIELASGGTFFVEEPSELTQELQAELVRVIELQELERVGSVQKVLLDVRWIFAHSKNLDEEKKLGRLNEKLFYILKSNAVSVPALRDRIDDLDTLVAYYLQRFEKDLGIRVESIDSKAMSAFKTYSWPGNLREFESVIQRCVLVSEGATIRSQDLPPELFHPESLVSQKSGTSLKDLLREKTRDIEKEIIETALHEMQGNVTRTAEKLGLSRKGLQLKMKALGMKRPV